MKTEFKVLPWLREVRDRHARETEGLTSEERVAALERETRAWTAASWIRMLPPPISLPLSTRS